VSRRRSEQGGDAVGAGVLADRLIDGDAPFGEHDEPVRLDGVGRVVDRHHHRPPASVEITDDRGEPFGAVEVETGVGLVEQEDGRVVERRPREGGALPVPA
jgi:hypothetical protein